MGPDGANIRQTEHILQPVAVAQGFAKEFPRIEEQYGRSRIDGGDMMKQHNGFGGKGGDDRDSSRKDLLQGEFQEPVRVQTFRGVAQSRKLVTHSARRDGPLPLMQRDDAHAAQPRSERRARVRSETTSAAIPCARHCARKSAISSKWPAHSGPNRRWRSSRSACERPGARPPVETVNRRSPLLTWAGM